MLALEDVKGWFKDTQLIIFDSRICINNSIRLRELTQVNDLKEHEIRIKEIYGFFNIHWFQCKFISVIQLSKLFSTGKMQKRSFYKFFNRLQNEKYDTDLSNLLLNNSNRTGNSYSTRKDILLAISDARVEISKFQKTIDGIIKLRDKIYAHTDTEKDDAKNVILNDVVKIQELAENTWSLLKGGFFGTTHLFEMTGDWHLGGIIESVAKNRKQMLEDIDRKISGEN